MGQTLFELCFSYVKRLGLTFAQAFLNPGSTTSITTVITAFGIAVAFFIWRRARRGRRLKFGALARVLLPKWLIQSPSGRADLTMTVLNIAVFSGFAAGAVVSAATIALWLHHLLVSAFGQRPPAPQMTAHIIMTVALYLAYELGYWTNHYASHRIPVLWEFHKVHHTAEHLSPLTNFRVHFVDAIVFLNFLAVFAGVATGLMDFALGAQTSALGIAGTNMILFGFSYVIGPLQHSHVWMGADGWLGRLVMTPAHHQLHHSDDPAHHNCNFGSFLSVWDWIFGTLIIPSRRRPALVFGAGPRLPENHTLIGLVVSPILAAAGHLRIALPGAVETRVAD